MKGFLTRTALAAAAFACVGAANATVIDFENVDTSAAPFAPLLSSFDVLTQNGLRFGAYDPNDPFGFGLVGSLTNGADSSTCLDGACPNGNSSNYLSVLNDALFYMNAGGAQLTLNGFDAAFLGAAGSAIPVGQTAFLAVEADRADGSYAVGFYALGGAASNGHTTFQSFLASAPAFYQGTGTLTSGYVDSIYAYAYYCNPGTGSCSFDTSNKGQFAIDNISVSVTSVPEPAPWMLMSLGLGLAAAWRRRRSS